MSASLEHLKSILDQIDGLSRSERLTAELRQAAGAFRAALERLRAAERRAGERSDLVARLARAEARGRALDELARRLAEYEADPALPAAARALLPGARAEADALREQQAAERDECQQALAALATEEQTARHDLRAALGTYGRLRRDLGRLPAALAAEFEPADADAREAERLFPAAEIASFVHDVETGAATYGSLPREEQFAQMKIWIGRCRGLMARNEADRDADDFRDNHARLQRIYGELVGLSRQHQPGFIAEFNREVPRDDWDAYVAAAREELEAAVNVRHERKAREQHRTHLEREEQERRSRARDAVAQAIGRLRELAAAPAADPAWADEFRSQLEQTLNGYGAHDPEVLALVRPHQALLAGNPFRGVRRALKRADEDEALRAQYRDVIERTRGLRAVLVGGSPREENRKELQTFFEFAELDWDDNLGNKPAMFDALKQRVRAGGLDLILILKGFVGHHVSGDLRPLCQQSGIPCLMVEQGYGLRQVAETLRHAPPGPAPRPAGPEANGSPAARR
jgi:hypothetical protein